MNKAEFGHRTSTNRLGNFKDLPLGVPFYMMHPITMKA